MLYLGLWRKTIVEKPLLKMLKNYCHISNQHPRIYLVAKFVQKIKILKFETKMPYLGVFGLEF